MSESVLTGNNVAARIPRGTTRLPIGSTQFTHNINFVGDTFQVTDVDEYRLEVNASVAGVMSDVPFLFEIFNETLGIVVQSTQHVAPGDGSYREICANLYFQVANPAHFWSLRMRTLSTLVGEPLNAINLQAPGYRAEITMFGGAAAGITGLGTVNRLPKFTAPAIIGDSNISDDGTTVTINSDAVVTGDLEVQGTVIVIDTQHVLIEDSYLYQNNGYTTVAAKTGGTAINYLPTALVDTVAAGGFTAGVPAVSNPTVATTGPATFALADLIQISGASNPANNGLFEVLSHAANVLTIRGVGLTATIEDFTQTQFVTNATVAGSIRKIGVSVMRTGTDGIWESGFGNVTPITFNDVATLSAAGTLNRVAKFTAPNTLGDSSITDTGALASCSVPFSVPGAGANSERFGAAATAAGASSLAIGNAAHAPAADSVVIGANAANATFSGVSNVLIGSSVASALTTGTLNTICGGGAGDILTTGATNCLYGYNAETQAVGTANSVGIGASSIVATTSVAIGASATANAINSVVIGYSADGGTTAALRSLVIGGSAANATFTGTDNVLIGYSVASALTSGINNTICGSTAGNTLTVGAGNCLFGYNVQTFDVNTSLGVGVGNGVIVAAWSVVIGASATANGVRSVVIGYSADGGAAPNATDNVVIGDRAANTTFSSQQNVLIGSDVASSLSNGGYNTICGSSAGDLLTTGGSNCLYGNDAETIANSTYNSVGIGTNSIVAQQAVVIGSSATANAYNSIVIGWSANGGTTAATSGVVIGGGAANSTFSGVKNILIGVSVASALAAGTLNTICGSDAGDLLTTGSSNCLYGYNAETQAIDTANSVGIGASSIVATTSVAIGASATANAINSVVIGYSADGGTTAATSGVVIGATAGNATFTGLHNSIVGYATGTALTSGDANCVFGSSAGTVMNTGASNCLFGYDAETQAVDTANSVGMGRAVVVHSGAVCLGSNAATTATAQFVSGSDSFPMTNVFFGEGASAAAPTVFTINGTASSGVAAGGDIRIAGGSSASGVGGSVTIQTTPNTAGNLANRQVVDLNGNFTFTQGIQTTGSPTFALWTGAAHTTLTASVEATDVLFDLSRTVEFSTGALTTQRAFVIENPTYGFVAASTITTAATFAILGAPVAGANATITNSLAFWVQAGVSRMDGGILGTRVVSAQTGATVTVNAIDSFKVYTNEGAAANVQFDLPTAAAGLTYTFIQQDSVDLVRVQAAAGDTIRDGGSVTAVAGYIKSTAQGDTVTLVAINATEWIVIYGTGNWTFDA